MEYFIEPTVTQKVKNPTFDDIADAARGVGAFSGEIHGARPGFAFCTCGEPPHA